MASQPLDPVDQASNDSFPASDPPAHGGVTGGEPSAAESAPNRTWYWVAAGVAVAGAALLVWKLRR